MPRKKQSTRRKNAEENTNPPPAPLLHRWMNVMDIASLHPDAADVLAAYGMHCIGCVWSEQDTLEDGAYAHGLTDEDIDNLLADLKDLLTGTQPASHRLHITKSAAEALRTILSAEGTQHGVLRVVMNDEGLFSMEWEQHSNGDPAFSHREVPDVVIIASEETLQRIGGSTIDCTEGRFQLKEPTKKSAACCREPSKKLQ